MQSRCNVLFKTELLLHTSCNMLLASFYLYFFSAYTAVIPLSNKNKISELRYLFSESEWIESYNPATQTLIPSSLKYSN